MERLFRDRMDYVSGDRPEGCFLCGIGNADDDESSLLLARRPTTLILINKFPYNTGHLLISPIRHVADVTDLTEQERAEMMAGVVECIDVLRGIMDPDGINFGANLGEAAGAGVPSHLHFHVVPRWAGDTNFMPVVGGTKVLPESLDETLRKLKPAFQLDQ